MEHLIRLYPSSIDITIIHMLHNLFLAVISNARWLIENILAMIFLYKQLSLILRSVCDQRLCRCNLFHFIKNPYQLWLSELLSTTDVRNLTLKLYSLMNLTIIW